MGSAAHPSLRDRLTPPSGDGANVEVRKATEVEKILRIAADLFGVAAAAHVVSTPEGLRVVSSWNTDPAVDREAILSAGRLLEALAASQGAADGRGAGVLEDIAIQGGFRAAAPVRAPDGSIRSALCLVDHGRKTLLSGLQRRLLAEFGSLLASTLDAPVPSTASSPTREVLERYAVQREADLSSHALAIFDAGGRCLLRNRRFVALIGQDGDVEPVRATLPELLAVPPGQEAAWLSAHLARHVEPVGVYRVCRPDGRWICVEERRTPYGRSLLARIEAPDAAAPRHAARVSGTSR